VTPNGFTHIRILILQYLAVDRSFPYHLNIFNDIPVNYTKGNIVNITTSTSVTTFYENKINYTVLASTIPTNFKNFGLNLGRNFVALYLSSIYNAGSGSSSAMIKFRDETAVINSE
jgi:hypothetical protein